MIQFKTHLCSLIHLVQFPNILCDNYHNWRLRQLVYICNLHLVYGHIDFPPLHQFCHMCSLQLNYKITFNTIITLQIFTGLYRVPVGFFFAISMEKGCKNYWETWYFSKGKIVYAVGKPCTIYRLWEKPYDNYRISLQPVNSTGFPYTIHNLSFLGVWGFSANLTALFRRYCWKNLRNPVQPCKPVKCRVSSVMTCWVLAKKLAS